MAECYKVAALDGLNKLSLWAEVESNDADMPLVFDPNPLAQVEALLIQA
jgi:hypothetical protein